MVLILEPDTPGGLRASMAWRLASTSATADDMANSLLVNVPHYTVFHLFALEWRRLEM